MKEATLAAAGIVSSLKIKVKVANEWQEQVTGLGLEIEHRNYSMNDAQVPYPLTLDQE